MKHFLERNVPRDAETGGGGGGGGSDDGVLAGDALKGTPFEGVPDVKIPAAFVKEGKIDFAGMLGAATRPDAFDGVEVPDKFKKDGKVVVPDFVKGYTEAEKALMRRREEVAGEVRTQLEEERAKAAPAAPGDYKAPEPWKAGERDLKIEPTDPMFTFFSGLAHQLKVPQDVFETAIKGYVEHAISSLPDWNVESKALGAKAEARLTRVDGFLKGNLSKESYAYMAAQPATATMVKAIEEIMTMAGHPPIVGDTDDMPDENYSRAQLGEMMRDPRYTGEKGQHDAAFVAKVRAGFQRLAKSQR